MVVSLGYSVIIALASVVLSLILYLLNLDQNKALSVISYIVLFGGILLSQLNYRNKYMGGYSTFAQSFTIGLWISLFLSVIMGIYAFVFFKYINPGAIEEAMAIAEQSMMDQGMTDLQIEQGMAIAQKFSSVGYYTIMAIVANFFLGIVFSLITSIFVKKEGAGFDQPSN